MDASQVPPVSQAYLDENNVTTILGVTGSFVLFSVILVCLRLYVRIRMIKSFGADDYVILAATVMAIASFACVCGEIPYGVGRHYQWIMEGGRIDRLQNILKWQFFHSLWLMFGVVFVKISVALFLMRIVPQKWWKISLWSSIAFLCCFALACAGTLIFSCTPVAASWTISLQTDPNTRCFSNSTYTAIGFFNSIINIITDVLFATLPIPIVVRLQVNRRTKISLIFILSLGFIACAAGIKKALAQLTFLDDPDRLYHNDFILWNTLEMCFGIIAATLPALKPLFAAILQGTRSVMGWSEANTGRTPAYPPVSQRSGPPKNLNHDDLERSAGLHDVKMSPLGTIHSLESEENSANGQQPYNVRVFSGRPDQSTWLSSKGSRNESEERLHQPDAIYATTEISQASEKR